MIFRLVVQNFPFRVAISFSAPVGRWIAAAIASTVGKWSRDEADDREESRKGAVECE